MQTITINWSRVGEQISSEMLQRRVSSDFVAHKAGLTRRTVDRARKGQTIRIQSLSAIEGVLELDIIASTMQQGFGNKTVAPASLGSYSKEMYEDYIGYYYMFRNSYDFSDRIVCSIFEIYWDLDVGYLRFRESQDNKREDGKRFQYSFHGKVSIPPSLAITQFIASDGKALSRIITTTSQRKVGNMSCFMGILAGTAELAQIGAYPAASPVFLEKMKSKPDLEVGDPRIGSFKRDEIWHKSAIVELSSVSKEYSAFH